MSTPRRWWIAGALAALTVASLVAAAPATPRQAKRRPVDFRCDAMDVLTKPNRTICRGNVVIRRPDLTLCCEHFEGLADAEWQWRRLVCSRDVRARRGNEVMWAKQAEFDPQTDNLQLTGTPLLQRGKSLLAGDRIVVDVRRDRARIEAPQGRIAADARVALPKHAPPESLQTPLPERCPIPPPPQASPADE